MYHLKCLYFEIYRVRKCLDTFCIFTSTYHTLILAQVCFTSKSVIFHFFSEGRKKQKSCSARSRKLRLNARCLSMKHKCKSERNRRTCRGYVLANLLCIQKCAPKCRSLKHKVTNSQLTQVCSQSAIGPTSCAEQHTKQT